MTINHNGMPIELGFHFGDRSHHIRETVLKLLVENKAFVLYSDDNAFKIYNPAELCSVNQNKAATKYGSIEQFKADLSFDIMIFDFVEDLTPVDQIDTNSIKHIQ